MVLLPSAPKADASANFATCAFPSPPSRARTYDLILKRDLLYQLSYGRKCMNDSSQKNITEKERFDNFRIEDEIPCAPTKYPRINLRGYEAVCTCGAITLGLDDQELTCLLPRA